MAWMTLLGLDWKGGRFAHPFDIVNVPHKPGVFKLHARRPDGEWDVFFVGEATNLYNTLLMYQGTVIEGDAAAAGLNQCAQQKVETEEVHYSYAVITSEKERKGSFRSIYNYYKPECNNPEHVPDVPDYGCNPF